MLIFNMSSRGSLSGYESESSMLSSSSYLSHTMEYVICETVPLHLSESNSSEQQYSCNICHTKTTQFQELRSHLFNHMGAIPYFCTLCNFSDISLTQLYLHLPSHKEFLKDSEKLAKLRDVFNKMVYSCNLCFFSFRNSKDLATHYMKHISNSYKCKSCKFVFFTETELLIHAHIHSLSLVCRVCDKTFPSSQKVFLSHVLSHDHTRLYRNFPKVTINHEDLPYYKSFFEICNQVTNVEFPMFCGILKTPHKNIRNKLPSSKDEKQPNSVIRIFDDYHPPSLENNSDQETIASSRKRRKSSSVEGEPNVFKLPDYPWRKKPKDDQTSPDPESNQAGIAGAVASGDKDTCLGTTSKIKLSLSPLKRSPLINENERNDFPIINHAYSISQQVHNGDAFNASNSEEIFNNLCQNAATESKPKAFNSSYNHLITHIKEELLDDTDEECPDGSEASFGNSSYAGGLNKFSLFSKSGLSDIKRSSSMNDLDIETEISGGRRVSLVLDPLPKEIVQVAIPESHMDVVIESPKAQPAFCFKELTVVIPKLPYYVKDLASFKRYEKRQKQGHLPSSSPIVTRSRRQSKSEDHSLTRNCIPDNVVKLNPDSISIHNIDNTSPFEREVYSPPKDITDIKIERIDLSPPKRTISNPLLQTFMDPTRNEGSDLDSMMDHDCSEHLCEEGEDCSCTESDSNTQSFDVEEDISSIRNRISLLKTALNSVQETSEDVFILN